MIYKSTNVLKALLPESLSLLFLSIGIVCLIQSMCVALLYELKGEED